MKHTGESISIEEYKRLTKLGKQGGQQISSMAAKPNKYRNKPVVDVDGQRFASKKEAAHIGMLKILEKRGTISELETQVKYFFDGLVYDSGRTVQYWADARYKDKKGVVHVVDVKGIKTPAYRLKRALMKYWHGIEIEEV